MRPDIRPMTLAVALGLALLASAQAGDRTYRWVDDKGRVHFSDIKTANGGERVQVKPARPIQSAPVDQSPAAVAARQSECQRKRDQAALYSGSAEIKETDSIGNSRIFTPAERQKLVERAEEQVRIACNQPGVNAPAAADDSES